MTNKTTSRTVLRRMLRDQKLAFYDAVRREYAIRRAIRQRLKERR